MTARGATPIRASLRDDSRLKPLVKDGLGALLKVDKGRLDADLAKTIGDSLDIDTAFCEGHEQENRWDYLLGHTPTGALIALEPHSANEGEISTVIKKREAAIRHLRDHLKPTARVSCWIWVSSGEVNFVPFEKARLRLNQSGIDFIGRRVLAKDIPSPPAAKPTGKSKR